MSIQNLLDNFDPIFCRISATIPVPGVIAPAHAAALLSEGHNDTASRSHLAGEPAPVPVAVPRPKQAADKDDWIAYAVSRGMDEAEARSMTKPQLLAALAE